LNIGFISLGCSKNLVDTEIMMAILSKSGHRIVNSPERSDLVIVNTCGFIDDAKEEAIDAIIEAGQLKESGIIKYLMASGCLVQRYGKELLEEMPELDGIVGISRFKEIAAAVEAVVKGQKVAWISDPPSSFIESGRRLLSTPDGMAYMKIAEGCNNHCAYCTIPSIRGGLRSKPLAEIEKEGIYLVRQGVKELVLIAQDTAAYGKDIDGQCGLPRVLEVLGGIEGLEWIRVMYLHPLHINTPLIESLASNPKVLPYLDIPIQHVSYKVLTAMNRRHDGDYLYQLFSRLRKEIKDLVLRTTVMLGFPGEEEKDFTLLSEFLDELQFDWLGAFVFTPEAGTRAAAMDQQVPPEVARERRDQIMQQQRAITRAKNIQRIGRQEKILVSSRLEKNLYLGRGYYQAPEVDGLTIIKSSKNLRKGELVPVQLKAVRHYDLIGEM
jgi:ribosomal protein S12 methylthiotransferase